METQFLSELNDDLKNGRPTNHSKKMELVPKLAASLHVIEYIFANLKDGKETEYIPEEIEKETLNKAMELVEALDEQKVVFNNVSNNKLL